LSADQIAEYAAPSLVVDYARSPVRCAVLRVDQTSVCHAVARSASESVGGCELDVVTARDPSADSRDVPSERGDHSRAAFESGRQQVVEVMAVLDGVSPGEGWGEQQHRIPAASLNLCDARPTPTTVMSRAGPSGSPTSFPRRESSSCAGDSDRSESVLPARSSNCSAQASLAMASSTRRGRAWAFDHADAEDALGTGDANTLLGSTPAGRRAPRSHVSPCPPGAIA
jgi:hypothetical protein